MKSKVVIFSIAIVVIVLGVVGWQWYEKKKEEDRLALINMGSDLRRAFDEYEAAVNEIEAKRTLAEEYSDLMTSILEGKLSGDELTSAEKKACEIEAELMVLYPTIFDEPSSLCRK